MRRLAVLGLDSVPPSLLFERLSGRLPHLSSLLRRGRYGALRTCDPPITVPAWAVLFTGADPGELGLYGFRHRRAGSYTDYYTPTPASLRRPPLWEMLSRRGLRVAVVGMPPGYPPPAVNGVYVGDFFTPEGAMDSVHPSSARARYESALGEPLRFDLPFRKEDREGVFRGLLALERQRWALAREIYQEERWDLFAVHDIAPDRFHHAFWKFFDPHHPRYDPRAFPGVLEQFYAAVDEGVGRLLEVLDPESELLLASDHGSKAMAGCFCTNEWLRDRGYLTLREDVPAGTPLESSPVDWTRTRVWGAGGYYARLFFNLAGREPHGIVPPSQVASLVSELAQDLTQVRSPNGSPLPFRLVDPHTAYRSVQGDAPDLMAYFGDLDYRSAGTLGHHRWFLEENDTGPDDAVHDWNGFYLHVPPSAPEGSGGPGPQESILDVAPTLLDLMGLPIPPTMQGRRIEGWRR
jgi:predicted AlkP superfamily phosphohydrolase/phosphomutase